MTASGPLGKIGGLLEQVIEGGSAKVAALLIADDPRILDGADLQKCLASALEKGHGDMAGFLLSIMDQKELLAIAPDQTARGPTLARL